ncbi:hypothetical protein ACQ4PT_066541 [Festuca glaucescens]
MVSKPTPMAHGPSAMEVVASRPDKVADEAGKDLGLIGDAVPELRCEATTSISLSQGKRSKVKRRTAAAATLPDDIVLEILARVADDLPSLFRCAVACKPWRALVADPSFLRRRWPEGVRHASSFLGLFGRPWICPRARIDGSPAFVSAPWSPLNPRRRYPGSFGPCTGGLLNKAVPLVSRQGLLLVRLNPQGHEQHGGTRLAVCDMFAGTCDVLPLLDGSEWFGIRGSAVLTDADCRFNGRNSPLSSYSTFFKVLIIGHESSGYSMYTFSSAESRWMTLPRKCLHLEEPIFIRSDVVVCRGKVRWLVWDTLSFYTHEFRIETGHICLIKLSIPRGQDDLNYFDSPRLSVTIDGNLSFLRLHWKCLKLEFWTRRGEKGSGNGAADWVCAKIVVLKPKKPYEGVNDDGSAEWLRRLSCMCVGETSGTLLITGDRRLKYIVNLETEAIEEVPSQFCTENIMSCRLRWIGRRSRLEVKQKE